MGLNDIVSITISRETTAVTQAGFGTYAIIAEFATDKTTTTFDRYRTYASLSEMSDDGWASGDDVYDMATIVFSQNPKLNKVLIGRKDSGDASWSEALAAVENATSDWYAFSIIASNAATFTFDADFITGNTIDFTINGTAVTQVPFNSDNGTTYADIKTQIETDITDSSVTIDAVARTVIVEIFGQSGVDTASVIVASGASQAGSSVSFANEDDYKAVAAWTETQKKIFFYASSSEGIYDSGSTTDIAYFMKNTNYDRTVSIYHTNAQGDTSPSWIEAGWPGECLPYDVGEQTWAYKTISAVASYNITSSQRSTILGKNCNIYTPIAGVAVTEEGKVASGEWIDIIRGVDKLEARLQEAIFSELVNSRKIPYDNSGIQVIEGIVKGVLSDFAGDGFLIEDTIEVSVPKYADISSTDKINRNLPDITFEASPQGAIHKVVIQGTISL